MEQRYHGECGALQAQRLDESVIRAEFLSVRRDGESYEEIDDGIKSIDGTYFSQCATHTHQLALDMQLSLLAPILVFFLQYKPLVGVLLIAFLILLSATLRYIATTNNYLSLIIFHGIS